MVKNYEAKYIISIKNSKKIINNKKIYKFLSDEKLINDSEK